MRSTFLYLKDVVRLPATVAERCIVGAGAVAAATSSATTTSTTVATASTSTAVTDHLLKARVDLLLGLLKDGYEITGLLSVYRTVNVVPH